MFEPLVRSACFFSLALSLFFPLQNQNNNFFFDPTNKTPTSEFILPKHNPEDMVLHKEAFSLLYNVKTKQADWVAYELTLDEVFGTETERSNNFKTDKEVPLGAANNEDYKKSGYDRGHLAPAADMKFSKTAMEESFLFTNISPQSPSFNRGIWSSLEATVRYWAVINEAVLIISGPIFNTEEYLTIGTNFIAIPAAFYKIILDYREPEKKGIAFIIQNSKQEKNLLFFVCSIDDVESTTGINFFPLLSPFEEVLLESTYNTDLWPMIEFSLRKHPYPER